MFLCSAAEASVDCPLVGLGHICDLGLGAAGRRRGLICCFLQIHDPLHDTRIDVDHGVIKCSELIADSLWSDLDHDLLLNLELLRAGPIQDLVRRGVSASGEEQEHGEGSEIPIPARGTPTAQDFASVAFWSAP